MIAKKQGQIFDNVEIDGVLKMVQTGKLEVTYEMTYDEYRAISAIYGYPIADISSIVEEARRLGKLDQSIDGE